MSVRIPYCLAVALLMAAAGNAGADSYQPSVGSAPPSSDTSATGSAIDLLSGADAYNQAAITDPYNQRDFSAQQSFGLTASQMLGAAAACEQLHSNRVSLSNQRMANAAKDSSDANRANLDAAQQHMLDPVVTSPSDLKAGEADCDRLSGSFTQLQQLQFQDQYLPKKLDQPGAVTPSANSSNSNKRR
jgi:hypothetical protein